MLSEPGTGCWLGAVGYLLLLDQIGTAVRPRPGTNVPEPLPQVPSIMKALEWFAPGETLKGRKVIYALRNALAHDYSLFNRHTTDPDLQHEFALHRGLDRFIQLPAQPWNGSYTTLPRDPTSVSLRKLGDTVEYACHNVHDAYTQRTLTIGSGLSPEDLAQRYTFVVGAEARQYYTTTS